MAEGLVFDIQRFSVHDGPGIRTTVFLKGCPLRCLWCHNPESQNARPEEYFVCEGESRIVGERMSVEQVMAEVMKDADYYERAGGGLTISGGEPMQQFEFTLELAREAKRLGLHVCLDTSGYANTGKFEAIAPYVDLFLYDYKETDPQKHFVLTGVTNKLIMDNFKQLYELDASITLRCPLVPGINDTVAHLAAIADLWKSYPKLRGIQLMPYHDWGSHKAARIGKPAPLISVPTAGSKDKMDWMRVLKKFGCEAATFG